MKNKTKQIVSYIGLFLFFGLYSYNLPLTGDDWTWGTYIGIDRLDIWFKDYNGRYVSNLLEIALTRSDWLRILVLTICSSLLVILSGKLVSEKYQSIATFASFFLYIMIPTKIFAQTFGWTAGYVNYVVSFVLLLLFLVAIKNIFNDEAPSYKKKMIIWMIPLGFVSQLVVEHITVFSLFTSFLVIVYTFLKHKKHYVMHWTYFISSLIGSIVMFTNGAYLRVLKGEDTYRTVTENVGILERVYTSYRDSMYTFLFIENVLINVILSVLVITLVIKSKSKLKHIFLFIILSFNVFLLLFKGVLGNSYLGIHTKDVEAIYTLIYFGTVIVSGYICVKSINVRIKLLYYVSGMVLLTLPFVFITPYGPRCVFGAYAFMTLYAITLLLYLLREYEWDTKQLQTLLVISSLVAALAITFIFFVNGDADRKRIDKLYNDIAEQKKIVEMTELPYPQYHWMPSPKPEMFHTKTFKIFHNIEPDVQIKIIPYFQSQR